MTLSARIGSFLAVRSQGELTVIPVALFFYVTVVAGSYQAPWTRDSRVAWMVTVPASVVERHLSPSAREAWRATAAGLRGDIPKGAVTSEKIWGRLKKAVDPRRWSLKQTGQGLSTMGVQFLVGTVWLLGGGLLFFVAIPVGISLAIAPYARREFRRLYGAWQSHH